MKTFKVYIRENGKLNQIFMSAPSREVLDWYVPQYIILQIVEMK